MQTKYTNKNKETTMFTFISILRRRSYKHSPSRTSKKLFTLPYKRQGKAGHGDSEVQSALCEDAVRLKRVTGV